ncbi:polysaccharide biosynthesis tyrosine autokinase [Cellulomonas shaoxiangyii]|uniref:Formate--tetrahydrofolate ligase n=1 Tax=Cellulomonas shaoxiangyii TaxID=2566013 RepID=A0A4P7SJH7_9CELL|nr:polysaccharide biosynthesis tyrosine autokinase [Cellulomonas shaoxiangyii]QCB94429.1 formate--tetrahydrofolate ligase [Cellulomonas shaoxiangyii]TGY85166.1 formate--tetrahydrofolate ligase [Cellulomonas shaoxiangyii]
MELDEYLLALRKRWFVIAALALLGGALALAYAQTIAPAYRASASVFVSVNEGGSAGELVQGSTFVQNSVTSFGRLASMPAVLEPVIADLDLDTTAKSLGKRVTADNPLNTVILEISTTDADPARAAEISNAVARQLALTVQDLSPRTQAGDSAIELTLVAPAVTPAVPFEPNTRFLTATGIGLGAVLGVALALLLTVLDTRLRTRADVERVGGLPVLGTIVRTRSARAAYSTVRTEPGSPRAEAFRRLQANLQYLESGRPLRTIVVTSAMAGEGKTSTSVNLATAVAERGASVLLVDADLRMPAVAPALGLEGGAGLTTVLIGRARLEEVVQTWGLPNLHVLPAGDRPPNPSQLLDSPAMHALLDEAAQRYDLVVVDSPPVLPVVDAALLGRRSDGVLLVTRLRTTRRQQLRGALAALGRVGATCLGFVATNWKDDGTGVAYGQGSAPGPGRRHGRWRRVTARRRAPATSAAAADHVTDVARPDAPGTPGTPQRPTDPARLPDAGAADARAADAEEASAGSAAPPHDPAPVESGILPGTHDPVPTEAVHGDDAPGPAAAPAGDDQVAGGEAGPRDGETRDAEPQDAPAPAEGAVGAHGRR